MDLNSEEGEVHLGAVSTEEAGTTRLSPDQLAYKVLTLSAEERAAIAIEKKARVKVREPTLPATDVPFDWRAALVESVKDLRPDEWIPIALELNDPQFPWHEFRNRALSESDIGELVAVRQEQLRPDLDALEASLRSIGASDVLRFWIAPVITARVAVSRVPEIAAWATLKNGLRDDAKQGQLLQYRPGAEARTGTRSFPFLAAGYDGSQGRNFTSSDIRVGIYDSDWTTERSFLVWHPGFLTSGGGNRVAPFTCESGTCTLFNPPLPVGTSHATAVMNVLGGSIELGQDPNFPTWLGQAPRSGIAPRPSLFFLTAPFATIWGNTSMLAMLQGSVTADFDIMNHSYSMSCACSRTCDPGLNTALKNSTEAGVLHIAGAGNFNDWTNARLDGPQSAVMYSRLAALTRMTWRKTTTLQRLLHSARGAAWT